MRFKTVKYFNKGFSLMELLIAIAIIGILTSIAAPTYLNYTRRAYYSGIVQATAPYKLAVNECFHLTGDFNVCNSGNHNIPPPILSATGNINSLQVQNGIIIVTPVDKYGITSTDDYVLTPTLNNNILTWNASGQGVSKGYINAN